MSSRPICASSAAENRGRKCVALFPLNSVAVHPDCLFSSLRGSLPKNSPPKINPCAQICVDGERTEGRACGLNFRHYNITSARVLRRMPILKQNAHHMPRGRLHYSTTAVRCSLQLCLFLLSTPCLGSQHSREEASKAVGVGGVAGYRHGRRQLVQETPFRARRDQAADNACTLPTSSRRGGKATFFSSCCVRGRFDFRGRPEGKRTAESRSSRPKLRQAPQKKGGGKQASKQTSCVVSFLCDPGGCVRRRIPKGVGKHSTSRIDRMTTQQAHPNNNGNNTTAIRRKPWQQYMKKAPSQGHLYRITCNRDVLPLLVQRSAETQIPRQASRHPLDALVAARTTCMHNMHGWCAWCVVGCVCMYAVGLMGHSRIDQVVLHRHPYSTSETVKCWR